MWSLNDQCYSSAWPDDRETYSLVVESCLVGKVDFTSKSSSWMRKEEFFQSGKAKRTSKTRSRSNCSKEGANQKERHKRKASDVQVASFVSAERSLCCWSQTPPLRSRCHHLLQPMLPFPRIPDRWEEIWEEFYFWPSLNRGFLFQIRPISRYWSFLCSFVRLESGFSLIFRLVLHWLFSVTLPFNGSCPTPALSASGLRESCLAKKEAYWNEKELQSSRQANSQWWRNFLC